MLQVSLHSATRSADRAMSESLSVLQGELQAVRTCQAVFEYRTRTFTAQLLRLPPLSAIPSTARPTV